MKRSLVLITGVSSGIGRACALRCLHDHSVVLGASRREPGIDHPDFHWTPADLTTSSGTADVVLAARTLLASDLQLRLTGLVHAAGASLRTADILDPQDGWHHSIALHATTPFALYDALEGELERSSCGSVVLVGSPVAIEGSSKPAYSTSKGAQLGLCSSLTTRGGRLGIRVNVVLPGPTITAMTNDWPDEKRRDIAASTALGRLCEPEEIAGVIAFLLGPDASCVTGAAINATAGAHRGVGQ